MQQSIMLKIIVLPSLAIIYPEYKCMPCIDLTFTLGKNFP